MVQSVCLSNVGGSGVLSVPSSSNYDEEWVLNPRIEEPKTVAEDAICEEKLSVGKPKSVVKEGKGSRPLRGRLLAVCYCVCVTVVLTLVKATELHATSILVSRNISQFLLLTIYNCWAIPCLGDILQLHFKLIFGRAFAGMLVMTIIYCVPQYISLAKLGILNQLTPVFTTIFGVIILRERPTLLEFLLSCSAIVGSAFVIQPEFVFGSNHDEGFERHSVHRYEYFAMGALMFAVAAEGLAMVLNRKAGRKNIPCTVLLWAHSLISVPVAIFLHIVFAFDEASILVGLKTCTFIGTSALCAILLLGFANQSIFLFANKYEKSSIVAVIAACCKVVFFFISDYLFFPEEMDYNFFHYFGGVLIVSAILGLLISNHYRQISFAFCSDVKTAD